MMQRAAGGRCCCCRGHAPAAAGGSASGAAAAAPARRAAAPARRAPAAARAAAAAPRAAAPPPLPFDPLRAHRAGRHARPAPPRAAAEADPPGSAEGDSFALPENFCIIESRDAVKDFASLQLDEIADNISARRNRIFLLMEEVRRLRIQQRLKVRRRRSGRWRADAGAAGLEKGWVECHNSRAAAAAV
jgi:hypothetical protein